MTEESSIFDFPAVLIRTSTERQEGVINKSIVIGGVDYETISKGIIKARYMHRPNNNLKIVPDYDVDNVSGFVVDIIKKYIDVINKTTWLKE